MEEIEEAEELCRRWVNCSEYLTVEIDTKEKTAKVIEK
jgi:hypothetical protein